MGVVIHVNFGGNVADRPVTKKRMAAILNRSTRWLELRVREGCPSHMDGQRRMFVPSEVEDWLAGRKEAASG